MDPQDFEPGVLTHQGSVYHCPTYAALGQLCRSIAESIDPAEYEPEPVPPVPSEIPDGYPVHIAREANVFRQNATAFAMVKGEQNRKKKEARQRREEALNSTSLPLAVAFVLGLPGYYYVKFSTWGA